MTQFKVFENVLKYALNLSPALTILSLATD